MARRQVLEIHCDRCGRLENQVPDNTATEKEFSLAFQGDKVVFQDLCSACRKSLANYVRKIARKAEKSVEKDVGPKGKAPPPVPQDKKNRA